MQKCIRSGTEMCKGKGDECARTFLGVRLGESITTYQGTGTNKARRAMRVVLLYLRCNVAQNYLVLTRIIPFTWDCK
jgi:hypothetical protein